MKKKIAADLTSLAHRILQIKDKENVQELQAIAKELYEKLTILVFTEKHFSDIKPTAGNREVEEKLNLAFEDAQKDVQNGADDVEQVMEDAQRESKDAFLSNDLSDLFVSEMDDREEIDLPGISTIQQMVTEMPDEAPKAPEPDERIYYDVEKAREQELEKERQSFTTNSLTHLVVPEDDDREEMDLPGIATISKMVKDMPDEAPQTPKPANKIYHDVEKRKEQELEKERQSFTTNSLTHLVVPEDDDREEMDLPGISTIQKMVFEMPDEVTEPKEEKKQEIAPKDADDGFMKTHGTTDLEQLTADFQTMPVFERKSTSNDANKPQSLNSKLNTGFKIGMNDRMGFVKHLFNGSNQDFNRVMSQLNTIQSQQEANNFINTMIKPDYNNWEGKESFENRFMELIERKYQ